MIDLGLIYRYIPQIAAYHLKTVIDPFQFTCLVHLKNQVKILPGLKSLLILSSMKERANNRE